MLEQRALHERRRFALPRQNEYSKSSGSTVGTQEIPKDSEVNSKRPELAISPEQSEILEDSEDLSKQPESTMTPKQRENNPEDSIGASKLPTMSPTKTESLKDSVEPSEQLKSTMSHKKTEILRPCINCGLHGDQQHHSSQCEGPTDEEGFLALCSICEDKTHFIDECPKLDALTDPNQLARDIVQAVIIKRSDIAPLRTKELKWQSFAASLQALLPDERKSIHYAGTCGLPPPLEPDEALRRSKLGAWKCATYSPEPSTWSEARQFCLEQMLAL